MQYKLFGSPVSPYARAARITFAEKRIDYEFISIGPADLHAPDYETRHPFRKLPSLEFNGTHIFETAAIMGYVDQLPTSRTSLRPVDPLARAHCEQWLSAASSYLYDVAFTRYFFPKVLAPQFAMQVDPNLVQSATKPLRLHLTIIERAISEGQLGASQVTLADLLVGAIYVPLLKIEDGAQLLATQPLVSTWVKSLTERQSFRETDV